MEIEYKRILIYLFFISLTVFVASGNFFYWQYWMLCSATFPMVFYYTVKFNKKKPIILERRTENIEDRFLQKNIQLLKKILLSLMMITIIADERFSISEVYDIISILSILAILILYKLYILTIETNEFAGKTVRRYVHHKIIDIGIYSKVRHPMYAIIMLICILIPLALDSIPALFFSFLFIILIIIRAKDEENFLQSNFNEYNIYMEKVRYRFLPHVF